MISSCVCGYSVISGQTQNAEIRYPLIPKMLKKDSYPLLYQTIFLPFLAVPSLVFCASVLPGCETNSEKDWTIKTHVNKLWFFAKTLGTGIIG